MEKWISVEERLPDLEVPVLCVHGCDALAVCARVMLDDEVWLWASQASTRNLADIDSIELDDQYDVTHWMSLPEMP